MSEYARIAAEQLAILSLCRASDSLEQAASEPTTWFFIIVDLHRALYAALVAALSGSAGIGAYPDKLQAEWIELLEARHDPRARAPDDFVLPFKELLSRAETGMFGPRLQLSPSQHADILKLCDLRGDVEHVKPQGWSLEVGGLPRMGATAAREFATLLQSFSHRLEQRELERVKDAIAKLEWWGIQHPSSPPSP